MVESTRKAETAVLVVAFTLPSMVAFGFAIPKEDAHLALKFAFGAGKVIQFLIPLVWVYMTGQLVLTLGRPRLAGVRFGLAFGSTVLIATIGLYHLWLLPVGFFDSVGPKVREKVIDLGVDSMGKYVLLAFFYSLVHSALEEYYWRWFIFGRLRRRVSIPTAIILSSLGFTAHHVIVLSIYFDGLSLATICFSLCATTGGVVWAWLYHRTGSLFAPWLSHVLIDAGIFYVGYELLKQTWG